MQHDHIYVLHEKYKSMSLPRNKMIFTSLWYTRLSPAHMCPVFAAPEPPWGQLNEYILETVYISQPGGFLDMCNYVLNRVFPFSPVSSRQSSFPTH